MDWDKEFRQRFDEFGYHMFAFLALAFAFLIGATHGLPIGLFVGVLCFAVLELAYQLYLPS